MKEVVNAQIKVLIADDHPVILEGITLLLKPARHITVAGFVKNGSDLLQRIKSLHPDVLILDVVMPHFNAAAAVKSILALPQPPRIICCSSVTERTQIMNLVNAGIKGYVAKTVGSEELVQAIETVMTGRNYFSKEITDIIIDSIRSDYASDGQRGEQLFPEKEMQIIRLICEEKSVKEISAEMNINIRTVESIKIRIMKKMGVRNVAGVVSYALKNHYVSLDDLKSVI